MAEAAVTEEPHKIFLLEDTLDVILSFIKDKKMARLVGRKWNDRLLATRKLSLILRSSWEERWISIFSLVDTRLLQSIRFISDDTTNEKSLRSTFAHLRVSGHLEQLRVLSLSVDERVLDYVITVINENGLTGLTGLTLFATFSEGDDAYRCSETASADTLPELRYLCVVVTCNTHNGRLLEYHQAGVQSLVNVASNLETIFSDVALDISERKVKKLNLRWYPELIEEEKANLMIHGARDSLTYLCMDGILPQFQPTVFPNLSTLIYNDGTDSNGKFLPINRFPFPALRLLRVPYESVPWQDMPKLLPPTGKLKNIQLIIPYPQDPDFQGIVVENLRLLLNAGLDRLSLEWMSIAVHSGNISSCRRVTIQELLSILELVELDEIHGKKSRVMEFESVGEGTDEGDLDYGYFTRILEKLGENWEQVRFKQFKFTETPSWKELEVPLFGGKKSGKVTLESRKENEYSHPVDTEKYVTVSLKIIK